MTIEELMEELSKLPPELPVRGDDPFGSVTYEIEAVVAAPTCVMLTLGDRVGEEEL